MSEDVGTKYLPIIKQLVKAYQYAQDNGWVDKLESKLGLSNAVLIAGASGVGKSMIRESLKNPSADAISSETRTEYPVFKNLRFDRQLFNFIDLPGQTGHRERRIVEYFKAMQKKSFGIINVVSYGYHEYANIDARDAIGGDGKARPTFLERHREHNEIDSLNELASVFGGSNSPQWLITVINKADLWWDDKDSVDDWYANGRYGDTITSEFNTQHSRLYYSSVFHKFYGVGPMAGSFDEEDRTRHRQHMINVLLEAIAKGS